MRAVTRLAIILLIPLVVLSALLAAGLFMSTAFVVEFSVVNRTSEPILVTLLLAIFSVAGMWFVKNNDAAPGQPGTSLISLAELLPIDALDRIALTRGGGQKLVFERQGGNWFQTEPFLYPMELFSIRQLAVEALQLETSGRIVPVESGGSGETGEVDVAAMGFRPPRATIEYQWPQGSTSFQRW